MDTYLISGNSQRPVLLSAKGLRSMPLMVGLMRVASRRTTNSNPSAEISVTYLLGAASPPLVAILMVGKVGKALGFGAVVPSEEEVGGSRLQSRLIEVRN